MNEETLDIDENCVMVLKNCGPRGYPGMAEVSNRMLPPKILRKGVSDSDMVRISDARMSGTAYGAVIPHACPEVACGGPLALAESGDTITLDIARSVCLVWRGTSRPSPPGAQTGLLSCQSR
jgi:L-arabonate dehydrase